MTKTNAKQLPRGGSPKNCDWGKASAGSGPRGRRTGSSPGRSPACRRLESRAPWPSKSPRVSALAGGIIGGVSLKQRTRATPKTESPRRGPGGGGPGAHRAGPHGSVRGEDGHRGERGKKTPRRKGLLGAGHPVAGSAGPLRLPTNRAGTRRRVAGGGRPRSPGEVRQGDAAAGKPGPGWEAT